MAVAPKVQLNTRATSLGGVDSLIEIRTPDNLPRLSIGLENPEDLTQASA